MDLGTEFDLLLKGGHVIDPLNGIDELREVAIRDGKIALVARDIPASAARKTVDVAGCYVTPGLIDLHVHVYGYAGSLDPDGYALPNGVTTVVDAGGAGWRNFEDFKNKVVSPTYGVPARTRVLTRVLAFLNIVGAGMLGFVEQDTEDMDPERAAEMVMRYPEIIVGIKTAHFLEDEFCIGIEASQFPGPVWHAVDNAVKAGDLSGVPAMFDVKPWPARTYEDLLARHLRPGDILTHIYNPRHPLLNAQGHVNRYAAQARERGVLFDVGHGEASCVFDIAIPAIRQGFLPDTISTDLHHNSRLIPDATLLTTMSKFMTFGLSLAEVISRTTVAPARAIRRSELGNLSLGAGADVAALQVRDGRCGFVDTNHTRLKGYRRLECALTLRAGEVVWDPDGISWPEWEDEH